MTADERAVLEQALREIEEIKATTAKLQAYLSGVTKRLDRMDSLRDQPYATGSRGPWLIA